MKTSTKKACLKKQNSQKVSAPPEKPETATASPKNPLRTAAIRKPRRKTKTEIDPQPGKTGVLLRNVLLFSGDLPAGLRLLVSEAFVDGGGSRRVNLKYMNGKVAVTGLEASAVQVD